MADTGFAAQHQRDRLFFLIFVIAAWIAIYMGFGPSITARFTGTSDYPAPLALEIHVWSFFGWMTLLTLQVALIRVRRLDLHRTLGIALLALVPVMAISGIAAEVHSQHFYASRDPENVRFFIVPVVSVLMFVLCAGAAFALRRDPPAHKRAILLATSVILVAAYGRWWGPAIGAVTGDGFWGTLLGEFTGPNVLIAIAMIHDLATRGRIHRVFAIGAPLILMTEVAAAMIYHLPGWPAVARGILGI